MALDTQVPPWLERNWAPAQSFDPTPWLQERYSRQIDAQTIPLKIQGMQLQNQAAQLEIEHQGIANEQASLEMQQFRNDLPMLNEWFKSTEGDPVKLLKGPTPTVRSLRAQQQVLNARKMAADTTLGMAFVKDQTALSQTAATLMNEGYPLDKARNDDGTLDPQKVRLMAAQRLKHKEEAALNEIYARQEHYYDPLTGMPVYGRLADRDTARAQALANLKQQLRDSQAITDSARGNVDLETGQTYMPDMAEEIRKQEFLHDQIAALEAPRGGSRPAAAIQVDERITELTREHDSAIAAGDTAKADELEERILRLKSIHPNFGQRQEIQGLRADRNAVFREMVLVPKDSKRYKELETRYNALREEMGKVSKEQPKAPPGTSATLPTNAVPFKVGRFQVVPR